MSWRGVGAASAVFVVLTVLVLAGPVPWLSVDEDAVPPSSDVPFCPSA
jgi:hypothetical protein